MTKKRFTAKDLAMAGVFAALVFVSMNISIPISLTVDITRIHLGNICVLLSSLLLGGPLGGAAAGIGAMFYDLINPVYITSAPFTLIFRFLMGFACGTIAYSGGRGGRNSKFNIIGAVTASLLYVALYLGRSFITNYFVQGMALEASLIIVGQKSVASLFNAAIGVGVSVPLARFIRKLLPQLFNGAAA